MVYVWCLTAVSFAAGDGVSLASSAGAVGQGDENLDFFGSNDALLMQEASASDDASESGDSESEAAVAGAEVRSQWSCC